MQLWRRTKLFDIVSHRVRRDHGGQEFLSRIFERTIRLKLGWTCSEKRTIGLIFPLRKSDQEIFSAVSAASSAAGER